MKKLWENERCRKVKGYVETNTNGRFCVLRGPFGDI